MTTHANSPLRIFVESVGVLVPGLPDWEATRAVLAGERSYRYAPLEVAAPSCLPAAERRRSSANVRLAIATAEQALQRTPIAPHDMAMVFASHEAAGVITHQICEVLAGNSAVSSTVSSAASSAISSMVSPTQFHNSVHNAPSGYYSIAMHAKLGASSVCRGHWSFAAGLLNAAAQVVADNVPVLFVCYDSPLPPPLNEVIPLSENTAVAMVLTPEQTAQSIAQWQVGLSSCDAGQVESSQPHWLPDSWKDNGSAQGFAALALLVEKTAPGDDQTIHLALSPDLLLQVARC